MLKRLTFILFHLLLASFSISCTKTDVNSSSNPSSSSILFYGNQYSNFLYSVYPTQDNGIVLGGYIINGPGGSAKGFIQKMDKKGKLLWYNIYGGPNYDFFNTVKPTSDGGYITAGATNSYGNGATRGDYYTDCYLVKTDADGKILWQKTFGGNFDDRFLDVAQTPDGGYVAVGFIYSPALGVQTYIVKTDKNGNTLWTHTLFPGAYFTYGAAVTIGTNSDIAVAVYHVKSTASIDQNTLYPAFVLLSPNGQYLNYPFQVYQLSWSMPYDRNGNYGTSFYPEKISPAPDGYVFAVNQNSSPNSVFLFKVDFKGNPVWGYEYYGLTSANCNDIISNGSGGFLISGGTTDPTGLNYTWLLNADANGKKISESTIPIKGYTGWIAGTIPQANGYAVGLSLIPSNTEYQDRFGLLFTDQNGKIIDNAK